DNAAVGVRSKRCVVRSARTCTHASTPTNRPTWTTSCIQFRAARDGILLEAAPTARIEGEEGEAEEGAREQEEEAHVLRVDAADREGLEAIEERHRAQQPERPAAHRRLVPGERPEEQ